jgi:long-chain fatty acid transport protein
MKGFRIRSLVVRSSLVGCLAIAAQYANASDFNLPFINASGLGNSYADWATATEDASSAFANPAALVYLPHKQLMFSGLGLLGSTKFTGTTTPGPYTGSASSRLTAFFPSAYYSMPISEKVTFALSETVPFGLGTNYAKDSIVRYLATKSQIAVIDMGPSIGIKLPNQWSVGFGLDVNRLLFTLNSMVSLVPYPLSDAEAQNHLYAWGLGWHGGLLWQPAPTTKLGLSFNSMTMYHASGNSESYVPYAPGVYRTASQKSNAALPARTQFSIHQDIGTRWAVMGTVFYTNWSTLSQLTLKNYMLPTGSTTSVTIPFYYHNTFDYSLGTNFKLNDKWILRAGFQIMNTPSNDRTRSVTDPIGAATVVNLGAHYQQYPTLGYDFGYAHSFFKQEPINQVTAVASANGHVNSQSSIVGAQVTWDIV